MRKSVCYMGERNKKLVEFAEKVEKELNVQQLGWFRLESNGVNMPAFDDGDGLFVLVEKDTNNPIESFDIDNSEKVRLIYA